MATGNDMKAHGSTYESFIGLLKWTVPVIALIGIAVGTVLLPEMSRRITAGDEVLARAIAPGSPRSRSSST